MKLSVKEIANVVSASQTITNKLGTPFSPAKIKALAEADNSAQLQVAFALRTLTAFADKLADVEVKLEVK